MMPNQNSYGYRGKSIGRLISYFEQIIGLSKAHEVQFKGSEIYLYGELLATVEWNEHKKYKGVFIPFFTFSVKNNLFNRRLSSEFKQQDIMSELAYQRDEKNELLSEINKKLSRIDIDEFNAGAHFYLMSAQRDLKNYFEKE